jgi:prolyl 4-hydroxylase
MKETLRLFDEEGDTSSVDLTEVYDHLAYAEFKLGNVKRAAHYTRLLLQNDPAHSRAQGNIEYFDRLMRADPDQYVDIDEERGEGEAVESREEMSEHERYESLCREPWPIPKEYHSQLTCFYYDNKQTPVLVIQPVKVEVVFHKPRLYVLRDILSEREMARLKELAGPILNRATARNAATGKYEPADYRISKRLVSKEVILVMLTL